jgi:hypothetical protein
MVRVPYHSPFDVVWIPVVVCNLTHNPWRSQGQSSLPRNIPLLTLIHQIEIFCEAVPKTAEVLPTPPIPVIALC